VRKTQVKRSSLLRLAKRTHELSSFTESLERSYMTFSPSSMMSALSYAASRDPRRSRLERRRDSAFESDRSRNSRIWKFTSRLTEINRDNEKLTRQRNSLYVGNNAYVEPRRITKRRAHNFSTISRSNCVYCLIGNADKRGKLASDQRSPRIPTRIASR
jgi:predicted transcriptional regulator